MSKRNFILLILILSLLAVFFFVYLYLNPSPATSPGGDTGGINFISRFNPFRTNTPTNPADGGNNGDNGEPVDSPVDEVKKLVKVSSVPIAGFTVFQKERLKDVPPPVVPTETTTPEQTTSTAVEARPTPPATEFAPALRYVGKSMGIIYQTFADKIDERRLSETNIPTVYDAYFGNNGETVAVRYTKGDNIVIETFLGNLPKERVGEDFAVPQEVKGTFLPPNTKDISLSPDKTKMFYLFESGDSMVGTILNFSDNKKTQVFDSNFTEWLSWWGNSKTITLSTKPSFYALGYAYSLDTEKRTLIKTLGGTSGLTVLPSPDGKMILVSDSNLSLSIYHTDTGTSDALGVRTLTEKCVWGSASDVIYCAVPNSPAGGQYPDSWYQGEVSFYDQIWKIDPESRAGTMLIDPTITHGEIIDGIKLALDAGENYLFFVNKKDSFLWEFGLK